MRWDAPATYGVANKRVDCAENRSAYNSKRAAPAALAGLIAAIRAPWVLVSVSDEGFHDAAGLERQLGELGYVGRIDVDAKRYVGAQIGIYNPSGEKVGTISRLRNRESLLLVGPDRALVLVGDRVAGRGASVRQEEGRGRPGGRRERQEGASARRARPRRAAPRRHRRRTSGPRPRR